MNILNKINHQATLYLVLFFTIAIFGHYNFELIKSYIKPIIENFPIIYVCWIASFGIFSAHYIFHKRKKTSKSDVLLPIFEQFDDYIAYFFSATTYAIAASTSLTLLKGVSLQYFYNIKYFLKDFENLDLATMSITISFLLYWSIMPFIKAIKEMYDLKDAEIIQTHKNAES